MQSLTPRTFATLNPFLIIFLFEEFEEFENFENFEEFAEFAEFENFDEFEEFEEFEEESGSFEITSSSSKIEFNIPLVAK
jgi:hypothetical protein